MLDETSFTVYALYVYRWMTPLAVKLLGGGGVTGITMSVCPAVFHPSVDTRLSSLSHLITNGIQAILSFFIY